MAMDLNLTRKWRPRSFHEVIGQNLSIRMLKNGLYLKKYFPLYIFSGQRGCGKTTTARIFAAALNCEKLADFQKDPKEHDVPCGKCDSCISVAEGHHPDFIEMDAASHTGVDNVRQILESASFVAISGGAKIYLIDEAHMLSKAAFNAFLKILEEPPAQVFFILATTELQKIPETVCSRAFQVFFNAIDENSLGAHLEEICHFEKINIDKEAAEIIVAESGGSARDAINLLERVRLLNGNITKEVLLECLGKISEEALFELFSLLLDKNKQNLLKFLEKISFDKLAPQFLWEGLVNLCRALVWIKHGATKLPYPFNRCRDKVEKISAKCSDNRLNAIMQLFFTQEELFLKTTQKHLFLETVLLQVCGQVNVVDLEALIGTLGRSPISSNTSIPKSEVKEDAWGKVLSKVEALDPVLGSIFKQATFIGFEGTKLKLAFSNNSSFFKDKLQDGIESLKPIIAEVFSGFEGFVFEEPKGPPRQSQPVKPVRPTPMQRSRFVNVSDKEKWPKANLLVEHFSGRIEMVGE